VQARKWLVGLRGKRGQSEIAKACNISIQFYSAIETGRRRPGVEVAMRIADELGFDWTRFYTDDPPAATA
jgi:putative transcriptional regulator